MVPGLETSQEVDSVNNSRALLTISSSFCDSPQGGALLLVINTGIFNSMNINPFIYILISCGAPIDPLFWDFGVSGSRWPPIWRFWDISGSRWPPFFDILRCVGLPLGPFFRVWRSTPTQKSQSTPPGSYHWLVNGEPYKWRLLGEIRLVPDAYQTLKYTLIIKFGSDTMKWCPTQIL